MDPYPIDQWTAALASGDEQQQVEALQQISSCDGVVGLTAVILALAGDERDEVRSWAAEAMEMAVRPEPADLPMLAARLQQSSDGEVCYWAATMLGPTLSPCLWIDWGPGEVPALLGLPGDQRTLCLGDESNRAGCGGCPSQFAPG